MTLDFPTYRELRFLTDEEIDEVNLQMDKAIRIATATYINKLGKSPIKWLMTHENRPGRFILASLRHAIKTNQELH